MVEPASFFTLVGLFGLAALALGYGLGAIPFGLVLTRLAGLGDIRKIGSGNIGATNVLRTGNKGLALAVLLLNSGKGAVAVLLATHFIGSMLAPAAAIGAVLGHLFPIWLGFRGGKGVATTLGTVLALALPVGLIGCAAWLGMALLFRISSLSALTAMVAATIAAWTISGPILGVTVLLITLLVWWKHAANIGRLLAGTEPKIALSKKQAV